jgi:hypothetical protein
MCVFGFRTTEDTYTVVGIPSGEVFYINELQLYNLYENDLIRFDFIKGFWYFEEKNRKSIEIHLHLK